MRTTLEIDDDLLALARHEAERQRRSLGATVSAMMRKGIERPAAGERSVHSGILMLPRTANSGPVTMEMVNRLRDELE